MGVPTAGKRSVPVDPRLTLPPEVWSIVLGHLTKSPTHASLSNFASRTKRGKGDYHLLAQLSRVCWTFFLPLRWLLYRHVDLSSQQDVTRFLKSRAAARGGEGVPGERVETKTLRIDFPTCGSTLDRNIAPSPASIERLIREVGEELRSVILFLEPQSRFFEMEDRATNEQTDMQSALDAFEDYENITELQLISAAINYAHIWPSYHVMLAGRRTVNCSLRLLVESSFPALETLSLERILYGYEAAVSPPLDTLRHLRLIDCGPPASLVSRRPPPAAASEHLDQLATLDVREPHGLSANLIHSIVKLHAGSLVSLTLFTSAAWAAAAIIDAVHPAAQPSAAPTQCFVGTDYLGDALASLALPYLAHLTLGGPSCVSARLLVALNDQSKLETLTLRGCGAALGDAAGAEANPSDQLVSEGISSVDVADWLRLGKPPKLRSLSLCAMGPEWLYRFDGPGGDYTKAREHRHEVYNPLDKAEEEELKAAEHGGGSALHVVCRERGIALHFMDRWID